MMDTLNEYEEMIDEQLKEWSTQIGLLTLKFNADRAKAEGKRDDDRSMRRMA